VTKENVVEPRAIAFNSGFDAFAKGPGAKNPYPKDTPEYRYWFAGYDSALVAQEEIDMGFN
jgi:hypothetical protein